MSRIIDIIKGQRNIDKVVYYKPNMSNLHGRMGKSIIETIKNTPPAPKDEARKKVEEYKRNILRIRNVNEHFEQ